MSPLSIENISLAGFVFKMILNIPHFLLIWQFLGGASAWLFLFSALPVDREWGLKAQFDSGETLRQEHLPGDAVYFTGHHTRRLRGQPPYYLISFGQLCRDLLTYCVRCTCLKGPGYETTTAACLPTVPAESNHLVTSREARLLVSSRPRQAPRPTPAWGSRLRKTQGGGLERLLLSCEGAAPLGSGDRSQTPRGKWLLGSWGPSESKSWGAGWRGQSDPPGKAERSSALPPQPVFCALRSRCSFSCLELISGFAQSRLTDKPAEPETQMRGEGETLFALQTRGPAWPGSTATTICGVVTWVL